MPYVTWAQDMPMDSNRTGGVSVNLRLDIYADGHGCLVSIDDAEFSQPVNDHTEMEAALRRVWDRGVHEAKRRKYFKV